MEGGLGENDNGWRVEMATDDRLISLPQTRTRAKTNPKQIAMAVTVRTMSFPLWGNESHRSTVSKNGPKRYGIARSTHARLRRLRRITLVTLLQDRAHFNCVPQ